MCVLFWRPRTDPGKEAMKPTRLVSGKFSLRCYLPLLLLHISSKETRSVQSWLHNPRKEKTRGARSRREDEEKGNQGRKNRRTGPRQSHCSSFARVTLHASQKEESTREEEPKSLRSLMIRWCVVIRNVMDSRSQGFVAGSRPSSLALWRIVRKPVTWQKSLVSAYFVSLDTSHGPDAVRSMGGRKAY